MFKTRFFKKQVSRSFSDNFIGHLGEFSRISQFRTFLGYFYRYSRSKWRKFRIFQDVYQGTKLPEVQKSVPKGVQNKTRNHFVRKSMELDPILQISDL